MSTLVGGEYILILLLNVRILQLFLPLLTITHTTMYEIIYIFMLFCLAIALMSMALCFLLIYDRTATAKVTSHTDFCGCLFKSGRKQELLPDKFNGNTERLSGQSDLLKGIAGPPSGPLSLSSLTSSHQCSRSYDIDL